MENFEGKVAAITGAGSGIGRALAVELARRGAHLALSDVDEAGLAETVSLCEGYGVKVTSKVVDVADRDAVFEWADDVVDQHGRVNLIVNNAGVALGAVVETMDIEDFRWLMDINFWGVVHGCRAFLPLLRRRPEAVIVNISSIFAMISVPTQSIYNAAKAAVRAFSDQGGERKPVSHMAKAVRGEVARALLEAKRVPEGPEAAASAAEAAGFRVELTPGHLDVIVAG